MTIAWPIEDELGLENGEAGTWEERGRTMPLKTRSAIKRVLDAIPNADLLGVMATHIQPKTGDQCLVCRLVSPEKEWEGIDYGQYAYYRLAYKYGVATADAKELYFAAERWTATLEEIIASRLNRIVA